jgi:magnesium-transporting ATPase (P-type)
MLTGDKLETAENIAISCNLISPDAPLLYIVQEEPEELESTLKSYFKQVFTGQKSYSLMVSGESLKVILQDEVHSEILLYLILRSRSAVICRATPMQKA